MRLAHNLYSLGIYKNYKSALEINSKALNNITSGLKINSAKDNPSKISQSENLKLQLLAREAAQSNIQDTNSMIQTFDGALQEINNNVSRLKELTVRAANGTNNVDDRKIIQKEINGIVETINSIAKSTTFNGVRLTSPNGVADGESTSADSPLFTKLSAVGELANEKVEIPFYDVTSKGLGLDGIDVVTDGQAAESINKVDEAVKIVSRIRSKYGALQSRLEDTYTSIGEINQNLSTAQSSIADADIAEEMLDYTRTNIMYQSSIGLMAQSNKFPQDALNVLASVR